MKKQYRKYKIIIVKLGPKGHHCYYGKEGHHHCYYGLIYDTRGFLTSTLDQNNAQDAENQARKLIDEIINRKKKYK